MSCLILLAVLPLSHCFVDKPMFLMLFSAYLAFFGSIFYLVVVNFKVEWMIVSFLIFKEVILMIGAEYSYISFL